MEGTKEKLSWTEIKREIKNWGILGPKFKPNKPRCHLVKGEPDKTLSIFG